MNKHQVAGRVKEASGRVQEEIGKVVGSRKLAGKGIVEKNLGRAQAKYGDIKRNIKKDLSEDLQEKRQEEREEFRR